METSNNKTQNIISEILLKDNLNPSEISEQAK